MRRRGGDLGGERLRAVQAHASAVADLGHRGDPRRHPVERRVSGRLGLSRPQSDLPGKDARPPPGPRRGRCCSARPPPSSSTTVRPSFPRRASPISTTAPAKSATKEEAGRAESSAGAAALHHPPPVQHADRIPEQRRLAEVVGDENRRDRRAAKRLGQPARRVGPRLRVESRQRLVEEQHARLRRQRARQRDPLTLATRDLRGPRVGKPPHAERAEQLDGAIARLPVLTA